MRLILCLAVLLMVGCGAEDEGSSSVPDVQSVPSENAAAASNAGTTEPAKKKRTLAPLTLGGSGDSASTAAIEAPASDAREVDAIIDRLKPLQVLLGNWRGTTRREIEGFKAVDMHGWVWDLQTDPRQPALVMSSGGKSPYVREARVTWLADVDEFLLTVTSPDDQHRVFAGAFSKPVEDVAGDDGKLQRTFALRFTQIEPADAKEQFQYTFNQQENNRYLLEIEKKRGKAAFRRFDTVSTQREGTSFALSDSDYGEKTCIISAGLGTMSVSYQGRTYWVCCSGCKAAFEEDPERWIKRAAEAKKSAK